MPAWLLSHSIPTEHIFKCLSDSAHYKTGLARSKENGDSCNNSSSSFKQSIWDQWSNTTHVKISHFIYRNILL